MNISSVLNLNFSNYIANDKKTDLSLVSFQGRAAEKLIEKIKGTKHLYSKALKLTFNDAVKIYGHLGYDVLMKRGSHAVIPTQYGNMPLVIPHKDKYISPKDVARLRFIIDGDIKKALNFQ